MKDEFLTIPEVAALLRITERTAYSLAREGKLPAVKVGRSWRVSRAALAEWARGRDDDSLRAGDDSDAGEDE